MGNSQAAMRAAARKKKNRRLRKAAEHPKVSEVLDLLKDDMIGTIAIWGMGGVGKTFILQQIYSHDSIAAAGFDLVVWWTFNYSSKQQPDIEALQVELAKLLRLTLPKSKANYAKTIYKFLNPKKFLLLIDGVWSWIELEKIGVPLAQFDDSPMNPNHKVVFASRSSLANYGMEPSIRLLRIDCLDWEASWILFQNTFGEDDLHCDPLLQIRAIKVAEKCGGLPLALNAAARAMSTMERAEVMFMPETPQLRDICGEANDHDHGLFPVLKLSYDRLQNDTLKKCFLLCSLWPVNFPIPEVDLVMCWMGHGLLGYGRYAFTTGHCIVEDLVQDGLLEFANDNINGRVHVYMHGVVRELASWIVSEERSWMVCAGVGIKEAPHQAERWKDAEKISLMYNMIQCLPSHPNCPNLSTLILQHNFELHIPDNFFQSMPSLTYLDLSSTACHFSPSVPSSLPNLAVLLHLQYLNLSRTMIESLPVEIGGLTSLEYLILSETRYLRSIPHGLISKLNNLLLLDLYASHYVLSDVAVDEIWERSDRRLWTTLGATITTASELQRLYGAAYVGLWRLWTKDLEGVTSLNLFEIFVQTKLRKKHALSEFTLSSCASLEEFVIADESLLGKIGFQNAEEFVMADGDPFEMHGFQNVEVMALMDLPKLERVMVGNWPYFNVRSLTISNCSKLKNLTWIKEFKNLEHLSVEACYGMEQLIDNNAVGETKSIFLRLRSLFLRDLPNLESICSYACVLPWLEDFHVDACPKLKWLPVSSEIAKKKFRGIQIKGSDQWWEDLVWEDYGIKSVLQPYFKTIAP